MKKFFVLSLCFMLVAALSSASFAAAPKKGPEKPPSKWDRTVVFETTQGTIEFKLFPDVAPKACENFVRLVQKGYYNGIIFHRVIPNFMIQGGDPLGTGTGGQSIWGKPFEDEFSPSVSFDRVGLLAMANAGPRTNGSQFFITTSVEHTRHLHMRHTIFGEVTKGMDVVKKIENTKTGPNDKPVVPQVIKKAYIKEDKK